MAARPLAAVIALNLPRHDGHRIAIELYEGLLPLAEQFHVAIAGGDTNSWDGPLVVSVTAFGEVTADGPLCRDGAKPGDRIVVTGSFGGSILGRHLDVEPRVEEALLLNQRYRLHAGIDCSDGLSLDLWRLCQASRCGAIVDIARIPIAPAASELCRSKTTANHRSITPYPMAKISNSFSPFRHRPHDRCWLTNRLNRLCLPISANSFQSKRCYSAMTPTPFNRLRPAGFEHNFT